jgi:hypothetical protein
MSMIQIAYRLKRSDDESTSWQTFLDQMYEGGSKMIINPVSANRYQYPKVTVNTALKDDGYRKRLETQYNRWKTKAQKPDTSVHADLSKALHVDMHLSEDFASKMLSSYEGNPEDFMVGDIIIDLQFKVTTKKKELDMHFNEVYTIDDPEMMFIKGEIDTDTLIADDLKKLSTKERFLIDGLRTLSNEFHRHLKGKESLSDYNNDFWDTWIRASNDSECLKVCDWLQSHNVAGSTTEEDEQTLRDIEVEVGSTDINIGLKKALAKSYTFHQKVFKQLGVTHVTLYRGVIDESLEKEPPIHSDKVRFKTRAMSSWSTTPSVCLNFGTRIVKSQVPIGNILASAMNHHKFGDDENSEFECVVIGAEDLECEVYGSPHR